MSLLALIVITPAALVVYLELGLQSWFAIATRGKMPASPVALTVEGEGVVVVVVVVMMMMMMIIIVRAA